MTSVYPWPITTLFETFDDARIPSQRARCRTYSEGAMPFTSLKAHHVGLGHADGLFARSPGVKYKRFYIVRAAGDAPSRPLAVLLQAEAVGAILS